MSFQGDVQGIGLAELLQGLARGRKEGLLSLGGSDRSNCLIGLMEGRLILLADEDEDRNALADRLRIARAHGLEDVVEEEEIEALGYSERLEHLYSLLDGGEVHFRFDPGELEQLEASIGPQSGTQLEFLLLEYARICDELDAFPDLSFLALNSVPQWINPAQAEGISEEFRQQIDGRSTVQEIGDRLSWPIRQARLSLAGLLQSGALRLSTDQELLALTLQEMEMRQFARACQRLRAWLETCPPGPLHPEVAHVLSEEWVSGRLPASMRGMQPAETRRLLRRFDSSVNNPASAVFHWNEAVQIHPLDKICRMHAMMLQYTEDPRSERPTVRDLLHVARELKDNGTPRRGAPLLMIAVQKEPEGLGQKLEVGLGLIEAGEPEHGTPWVLAATHSLVDRGQADRALNPLRALIEASPNSREAKALYAKARRASTQAKKMRRNLAITAAIGVIAGAVALVKVRSDRQWENRYSEVQALIDTPEAALAMLQQHFKDDESPLVLRLQQRIEKRQLDIENEIRLEWLDGYKKVHDLAKNAPPAEALVSIRALSAPPRLVLLTSTFPPIADLYLPLGEQFQERLSEQGEVLPYSKSQAEAELELLDQCTATEQALNEKEKRLAQAKILISSLASLRTAIAERSSLRAELEEKDRHHRNLQRQDELRELAMHAEHEGDYEQALLHYQSILEGELDQRIREFIQPQAEVLSSVLLAIDEAKDLALAGDHERALALLDDRIENKAHLAKTTLPWRVVSFPTGVRVTTSTGRSLTTPFEIETATQEHVELTFTSPGFLPRTLHVNRPQDLSIFLERTPENTWRSQGRVDAIPVPFQGDRIVVDRNGSIARLRRNNGLEWTTSIPTLSGVARAPVFFPGGSEKLLLVTEEGSAWLVHAGDGKLEGPWDLKSPPLVGPLVGSDAIHVLLANGTWAQWVTSLEPKILGPGVVPYRESSSASYRYGPSNGMQVLRSRDGEATQVTSRFNGWTAEVTENGLIVTPADGEGGFSTQIAGPWTFMAWEPAGSDCPDGRLWLSDGLGLRSFVPRQE
ncbi:MAG: DUF4388 domain-containing protein [bacterium]|nr:DUF4388 domain-containing protein [bacterium]